LKELIHDVQRAIRLKARAGELDKRLTSELSSSGKESAARLRKRDLLELLTHGTVGLRLLLNQTRCRCRPLFGLSS
jgi:hypothetical protein